MNFARLPRFKRNASFARIRLTDRDKEIIKMVFRYRFIRSSQILKLIEGSRQQSLRRLQLLYHHGFLERPRAQIDYYHQGGSRPMVYGIGNKGAALWKNELNLQLKEHRWSDKNRSVGRIFLEHALLVSDIMVAFELACRANNVRLLTEDELRLVAKKENTRQPFRWNVNLSTGEKLGVIPDRVFGLEYSDQTGKRERAFFFLEADRGTMPVKRESLSQTSFYRKLLAYEATWSQSIHVSRFGFHRFRVLTVTTSTERLKSLVEVSAQLKTGQGLFLFTHTKFLASDLHMLSAVWRTTKRAAFIRLLS